MREIGFRVWVGEEGVFADECCVYGDGSASYEIKEYDSDGYFIKSVGCGVEDIDSLEQYTGLKDKIGTKIFKGDIVTNESGRVGMVVFNEYMSCFDTELVRTARGDTSYGFRPSQWHTHVTVIGNVHQNKELIGG